MKKLGLACSLILLAAVALADVEAGDRAYDSGAFPRAIAAYRESVERDPTDVEARYKLARALSTLADTLDESEARAGYVEAAEHARAAITIDPEDPEAQVELARALGRFAELTGPFRALDLANEVRRRLELALELDPDHSGALHGLAMWHFNVPWILGGRQDRVRPLFDAAIAADPTIEGHLDYGAALVELDDLEGARRQLEQALSLPVVTYLDRQNRAEVQRLLDELGP
ncbi:MAG: tetratricopeptide repeat protein [Truepera sp.]|nr:tetratricopeptide repeat protein [Truepera sp.]